MSWIERELKKRAAEAKASVLGQSESTPEAESESQRVSDLWAVLQRANSSLPENIQLEIDKDRPANFSAEDAGVFEWLRARNGSALGLAGSAIRYIWPERGQKTSKNFWIRWSLEKKCYVLIRRVSATLPPRFEEHRFGEQNVEHILKCLVQGKRVKPSRVQVKRFWFF